MQKIDYPLQSAFDDYDNMSDDQVHDLPFVVQAAEKREREGTFYIMGPLNQQVSQVSQMPPVPQGLEPVVANRLEDEQKILDEYKATNELIKMLALQEAGQNQKEEKKEHGCIKVVFSRGQPEKFKRKNYF